MSDHGNKKVEPFLFGRLSGWLRRLVRSKVGVAGAGEGGEAQALVLLRGSELFDAGWYLHHYPDVAQAGIDPALHYLKHGWKEGRRPGPVFDELWYLSQFPDAAGATEPPLVHYLRIGRHRRLAPNAGLEKPPLWWDFRRSASQERGAEARASESLQQAVAITVVVPVFNAPEAVDRCLTALTHHLPQGVRLLIIDDASTDPAMAGVLAGAACQWPQVEILRHSENQGYTATVNEGIRLAGTDDVVLLNSDTQVGPGWLTRLYDSAYRASDIASVTALSNNAGAFTAAAEQVESFCGASSDFELLARAVAQTGSTTQISIPTGSGFCLYLKRSALNEVGLFDEQAFPRGYGEENDWCQRAEAQGWRHVIDGSVFVYHTRSASFGAEKQALLANAEQVIHSRYPDYPQKVTRAFSATELQRAKLRISEIAEHPALVSSVRPRVLTVISNRSGGTYATNQDLMRGVSETLEPFVLWCDRNTMTLYWYSQAGEVEVASHRLTHPIEAIPHRSAEYNDVLARWLVDWAIELVHVRHLAWHSVDIPVIAKRLMIPCVLSFHDYYSVCPTVKLLDDQGRFCGGVCTPGQGHCKHELWPEVSFSSLKHDQIQGWQAMFREMLPEFSGFVTTSPDVRALILGRYPELTEHRFEVIPHGRDFGEFLQLSKPPVSGEPLRVVIPGHLTLAKGGALVAELAQRLPASTVEFHILGSVSPEVSLPETVICHGEYQRDEFAARICDIQPHVGAVLSIWPETWCHTLTELWSVGLSVVGLPLGAVGDRIAASGAGWLANSTAVADVMRVFEAVADESDWRVKRDAVYEWQHNGDVAVTVADMAAAYLRVYESVA